MPFPGALNAFSGALNAFSRRINATTSIQMLQLAESEKAQSLRQLHKDSLGHRT